MDVGVGKGWVEAVGGVRRNLQLVRFSSQKLAVCVLSCENSSQRGRLAGVVGGWISGRPLKGRQQAGLSAGGSQNHTLIEEWTGLQAGMAWYGS